MAPDKEACKVVGLKVAKAADAAVLACHLESLLKKAPSSPIGKFMNQFLT